MALSKGTNSYVTVNEADAYFTDRIDADDWTAASPTKKAQALITATSILDEQPWTGTAIVDTQPLAFPRAGIYFDPRVGTSLILDDSYVPTRVVNATCELAMHLITNSGLQNDTGSVLDLSVGPINLQTISKPNLIPARVKRLINPILENGGSRTWWRAN